MTTDGAHHHLTWRAHLWWALLILMPFLVSHAVKALGPGDTATTLLLYGPVIASIWIGGHLALVTFSRGSGSRSATPAATSRPG
jgi:hypothetical protein